MPSLAELAHDQRGISGQPLALRLQFIRIYQQTAPGPPDQTAGFYSAEQLAKDRIDVHDRPIRAAGVHDQGADGKIVQGLNEDRFFYICHSSIELS